ncbi:MAG: hypothetical protein HOE83_17155 [Alphaproteobacteria bacterium]|nr:hypothetical protein [Alphaproteobacteria bacterium]
MAIDKAIIPSDLDIEEGEEIEIGLPDDANFELVGEETGDDGSVVVDFDPDAGDDTDGDDHQANLAEVLDDTILTKMASELVESFKDDKLTREPWEKAYTKGLALMGLNIENRTQPWAGASGVFHPILTEAVIKFQADAMTETFPAKGPVMVNMIGKLNRDREKQIARVKHDMNYYTTEVIPDYRSEHEQTLFHLGIAGSVFKKLYYDEGVGRPTARFVMADDLVVAYGTTSLLTCPRITHVMKEFPNDLRKAQVSGRYRDVDVPKPSIEYTDVDKAEDKASGTTPNAEKDDRHTLLEMHVEYDIPGFEDLDDDGEPTGIALPYIVTIEKSSDTVLSIYRNWDEEDELKLKNEFFIHYPYLPGLGFYGIGLTHLLGGIAKSATSVLRQLVDAGTLSNLPAGLKSRGLRIKGDNSPLRPGEFRDVDVPGGSIKDNITFVPYKEPSAVLYQLLGSIVEEGRNIASIADLKISDMNSQAPVGTTLAILERGMKVMSGVNARIFAAMKQEFRLLASLIKNFAPAEYEYEVEDGATRTKDYDDRVDILPVANPNASTMAHRIMRHQAIQQMSLGAPEIYDKKELHRSALVAMGEENVDKLIPVDDEMKPMDPVAENMAIMTGKPIKAHLHQDHESHIRVHMAASQDPKIMEIIGQSPSAPAIAAAGAAHIQEHVAFQYRREIEKQLGVPMPEFDADLPAETEVYLSKLIADAADKVLQKDLAEAKAKKNAEEQNDPVLQIQKLDAETKAKEVERKGKADMIKGEVGMQQIASKEKIEGTKIGIGIKKDQLAQQIELKRLEIELERIKSQEKVAGTRIGADVAMGIVDDEIERERIASQAAQSDTREGVNLRRNDQMADAEQGRLRNERLRDTKNAAAAFANTTSSNDGGEQKGNKDE